MPQDETNTKRFHADIPISLDRQIKELVPWGTQSEVMRQLLLAFVNACRHGEGAVVVHHTLQGNIEVVSIDPKGAPLKNNGEQG